MLILDIPLCKNYCFLESFYKSSSLYMLRFPGNPWHLKYLLISFFLCNGEIQIVKVMEKRGVECLYVDKWNILLAQSHIAECQVVCNQIIRSPPLNGNLYISTKVFRGCFARLGGPSLQIVLYSSTYEWSQISSIPCSSLNINWADLRRNVFIRGC